MNIKVLTNVRADSFFLDLWLRHYGTLFGRENLHVMLDGDDWTPSVDLSGVTLHVLTDVPETRTGRDNFIADWQSNLARRFLNSGASVVLRSDIDEFVAVDPRAGLSLPDYLDRLEPGAMCAALGLDVVQGPAEAALDAARPILAQRRNAVVTREYCKLVAVRRPPRWASGFHRSRRTPIDIGPDLLLFHLALFDRDIARQRIAERAAVTQHRTEGAHITRRQDRFDELRGSSPVPLDDVSGLARAQIMTAVPSPTGPHPGHITDGNSPRGFHVTLPDRLAGLLPPLRPGS
jgi:hypothetical protein